MNKRTVLAILVALPVVACSGAPDESSGSSESNLASPAPAPPAPAPAATPMPDSLHWFRDSAEYQAASRQAYVLATALVDGAALSRYGNRAWGVIVDGDETILDNSAFQKESWQKGLAYTPARWSAWVQSKQSRAIPGAAAFTRHVRELGGKVVVVTNGAIADCPAYQSHIGELGIEIDDIKCQTDTSDKNPRFTAVQQTIDVVLWVGDNINDFPNQSQAVRTGGDAAFADWGSRFVVMPNPMYGSWQGNPQS
jgi:5'-nucleotidase (lipoprotein e(P4) family)